MNTFDFIILILLAAAGIIGFQKGLITGLTRFVGKIIAIGIAFVFHSQFINLLENIFPISKLIESSLSGIMAKILESKMAASQSGGSDAMLEPFAGSVTAVITDYILIILSISVLFFIASILINLLIGVLIALWPN